MADREIAGRCTCPICGATAQDVRVNIHQKLYGYCDHGCSFKFNSVQSKQFLPLLRAGRNVATSNGITIFSTVNKGLENAENKGNGTDNQRNIRTGSDAAGSAAAADRGNFDAGRRKSDAAAVADGKPARGFFAAWLGDDDEE